jgi:hypothetical protein
MSDLCRLIWCALIGLFRPRAVLEAENLVLRHQLDVLWRKSSKRLAFSNVDRLVFAGLHMLRHACGCALANAGHDTRALQAWLGHRNIQHGILNLRRTGSGISGARDAAVRQLPRHSKKRIRETPGRPDVRAITKQSASIPGTVQRISRPFSRFCRGVL